METLLVFNGVRVLLTTGETLHEVQNCLYEADVVISIYPDRPPLILRAPDNTRPSL